MQAILQGDSEWEMASSTKLYEKAPIRQTTTTLVTIFKGS